jgi:hypothetical protein
VKGGYQLQKDEWRIFMRKLRDIALKKGKEMKSRKITVPEVYQQSRFR